MSVQTSMFVKSIARMTFRWDFKKVFHEPVEHDSLRCWAGSMPFCFKMFPTVWSEISCPRFLSAPWMRSQPQFGFSLAIRNTSA